MALYAGFNIASLRVIFFAAQVQTAFNKLGVRTDVLKIWKRLMEGDVVDMDDGTHTGGFIRMATTMRFVGFMRLPRLLACVLEYGGLEALKGCGLRNAIRAAFACGVYSSEGIHIPDVERFLDFQVRAVPHHHAHLACRLF